MVPFWTLGRLICVVCLLVPVAAGAEQVSALDVLDTKTEYTADYYLALGQDGEYRGTVIHAPARERREFTTRQGSQVLVIRRDLGEATMMWPERKWYVTVPMGAVSAVVGDLDGALLDRKRTGSETIAGESCTRYDVSASTGTFNGRMWFSRDGILIKAKGTLHYQGREVPVETGVSHVLRIKADPSAFVQPADYKGLPFDPSKLNFKMSR